LTATGGRDGTFSIIRREFLGQFGLIGSALNERLDRGVANDEADREPRSYSSAAPNDDILYKVSPTEYGAQAAQTPGQWGQSFDFSLYETSRN